MFEWLALFLVGWFGSNWWPGQAQGAPNPKDPHPWEGPGVGIIAGIAAVVIVPMTGISDGLSNLILGIAAGCIVGNTIKPFMPGRNTR